MVSRVWGQVSLGALTKSVHEIMYAKSELGVKGRQKLARATYTVVFRTRPSREKICAGASLVLGPLTNYNL